RYGHRVSEPATRAITRMRSSVMTSQFVRHAGTAAVTGDEHPRRIEFDPVRQVVEQVLEKLKVARPAPLIDAPEPGLSGKRDYRMFRLSLPAMATLEQLQAKRRELEEKLN